MMTVVKRILLVSVYVVLFGAAFYILRMLSPKSTIDQVLGGSLIVTFGMAFVHGLVSSFSGPPTYDA
jgi:hypothetical protein